MNTTTTSTALNLTMRLAVGQDDARMVRELAKAGMDVAGGNWLDMAISHKSMNVAAAILMRSGSKATLLNTTDNHGDTLIDKAIGLVSEKFLAMLLSATDKLDLLHTNSTGLSTLDLLVKLNSKTVNDALVQNHYLVMA